MQIIRCGEILLLLHHTPDIYLNKKKKTFHSIQLGTQAAYCTLQITSDIRYKWSVHMFVCVRTRVRECEIGRERGGGERGRERLRERGGGGIETWKTWKLNHPTPNHFPAPTSTHPHSHPYTHLRTSSLLWVTHSHNCDASCRLLCATTYKRLQTCG